NRYSRRKVRAACWQFEVQLCQTARPCIRPASHVFSRALRAAAVLGIMQSASGLFSRLFDLREPLLESVTSRVYGIGVLWLQLMCHCTSCGIGTVTKANRKSKV